MSPTIAQRHPLAAILAIVTIAVLSMTFVGGVLVAGLRTTLTAGVLA